MPLVQVQVQVQVQVRHQLSESIGDVSSSLVGIVLEGVELLLAAPVGHAHSESGAQPNGPDPATEEEQGDHRSDHQPPDSLNQSIR